MNDKEFPDAYQEIPKEYQRIRNDQLGCARENIDAFRTYFNNLFENSYYSNLKIQEIQVF